MGRFRKISVYKIFVKNKYIFVSCESNYWIEILFILSNFILEKVKSCLYDVLKEMIEFCFDVYIVFCNG